MLNTCKDMVFGNMEYKHRWFKKQDIFLFEKKWEITVSAMAYSGKPINDAERIAYKHFMKNEKKYISLISEKLKVYINENLSILSEFWPEAKIIEHTSELGEIVTPQSLVFMQDGTTIVLLDCVWDKENGIAVKIGSDIEVGAQCLFL